MLSGNRNFEGRINPDVKMNYLASPPLVVAYALAGTMDFDFESQPLGTDKDGRDGLSERHLAVAEGRHRHDRVGDQPEMFTTSYATCSRATSGGATLPTPSGNTFEWDSDSTYVRKPPYFEGMPAEPEPGRRHHGRPGAGTAGRLA